MLKLVSEWTSLDLKARPVFHHKRNAIEAHLTIVFTSLAISRQIEKLTGTSIKRIVKILRPIRSGLITINGKNILLKGSP